MEEPKRWSGVECLLEHVNQSIEKQIDILFFRKLYFFKSNILHLKYLKTFLLISQIYTAFRKYNSEILHFLLQVFYCFFKKKMTSTVVFSLSLYTSTF